MANKHRLYSFDPMTIYYSPGPILAVLTDHSYENDEFRKHFVELVLRGKEADKLDR